LDREGGRLDGAWGLLARLTATNGVPGDQFGFAVALSAAADTLLVGAYGVAGYTGAAYVFQPVGGMWTQTAQLTANDHCKYFPSFGTSVSLSANGTVALVGADRYTTDVLLGVGAAYLFQRNGQQQWALAATLGPAPPQGAAFFGSAASLSHDGTVALVGANGVLFNQNDTSQEPMGAVYVFAGI
jgi:hypothetical protein